MTIVKVSGALLASAGGSPTAQFVVMFIVELIYAYLVGKLKPYCEPFVGKMHVSNSVTHRQPPERTFFVSMSDCDSL